MELGKFVLGSFFMKIKACDIVFESEGEDRLIRKKKTRQLQKKICQHIVDMLIGRGLSLIRLISDTCILNMKCFKSQFQSVFTRTKLFVAASFYRPFSTKEYFVYDNSCTNHLFFLLFQSTDIYLYFGRSLANCNSI